MMSGRVALSVAFIAAGSLPMLWVSRRFLLRPSSFGFYRFFAFEAILALIVLNAPSWFGDPLAARQLASWLLLAISAILVLSGLRALGRGRPDNPAAAALYTTSLVTSGPYRYIRHPLYASLLFLAWGALLKSISPLTLALAVLATAALVATAKTEEGATARQFGEAYQDYMARTRRFVPYVF